MPTPTTRPVASVDPYRRLAALEVAAKQGQITSAERATMRRLREALGTRAEFNNDMEE